MTTTEFEAYLKTMAKTDHVYHLSAPAGVSEYVVWHGYGHNQLIGDDGVRLETLKIQLDIIWQDKGSDFPDKIKEALTDLCLPYFEADYGYDDAWASMRCILQTELD